MSKSDVGILNETSHMWGKHSFLEDFMYMALESSERR